MIIKKLLLPAILIFSLLIQDVHAQSGLFEKRLAEADSLWKINKVNFAKEVYEQILGGDEIPVEYLSLVNLKLPESHYQLDLYTECVKTISTLRLLPFLPDHHLLKADDLVNRVKGISVADRTVINNDVKTIASIYVSGKRDGDKPGDNTYKTMEEALAAAQTLLKEGDLPEGSVDIIIDCSSYNIKRPIKIGSGLSGTRRNPVIIRSSSPDRKVIISGGVNIKKWKKETNRDKIERLPECARGKFIVADLRRNGIDSIDTLIFGGFSSQRAARVLNSRFNSLPVPEFFYDGKPQLMSRWPNTRDTLVSLANFRNSKVLRWTEETDLWLHGYWKYMWADAYEKVGSVSVEDTVISP